MFGDITLPAAYGRDPTSGKMVMPLREALGLHGHQPMSPVLEDRLRHLAITATSYERAAEVARRFGIATDDSQASAHSPARGGEGASAVSKENCRRVHRRRPEADSQSL
jgi:hypothetical protein